jgi:osmoprotectant transport system substrate-binding protein
MRSLRTVLTTLTIAAITMTAVAGCSGSDKATVKPGSLADIAKLKDASFTVGSKEFAEQLILCHITSLALQSVGATVHEKCGLQGSNLTRASLATGSIDMYWEYTGTAWINHNKHDEPINDPARLYDAVAKEDLEKNNIWWGVPAPANNTYAIAVKTSTAQELRVATISDYANLVKTNPAKASMCVASEFNGRNDGLPGLQTAYGFTVPPTGLSVIAEDALYLSVAKGDPCIFSEATTTDGRVKELGLTILDDDKHFFPIYNPALTVREPVYKSYPDLAKISEPLAKALTDEELLQLNGQVDIKGEDPAKVAQSWLETKGFIGT